MLNGCDRVWHRDAASGVLFGAAKSNFLKAPSTIMGFLTPPPGYSPAKLCAGAVLSLALCAVTFRAAFDRDTGAQERSTLSEAQGRLIAVNTEKRGVTFRLRGRTETFNIPTKTGGAGSAEVSVLYDPEARRPMFSAYPYLDVWQLAIDGKAVWTVEQSREGWRSDNAVALWLFWLFLASSLYFLVLAQRARRLQVFS